MFQLKENNTTVVTEIRAGMATFLTMAYILFVNPQILSEAGIPVTDATLATALASAAATLVMGLYANYPFALAPGMGLNAYFTYGVVIGMGVSCRVALAAVFMEGLCFLVLAVGGIRAAIMHAIPLPLRIATTSGIGLFLAIIGFRNSGLTVDSAATLVTVGDLTSVQVLLSLGGLLLMGTLLAWRVQGAILIGIVATTATAWLTGCARRRRAISRPPRCRGKPSALSISGDSFQASWPSSYLRSCLSTSLTRRGR